MSDLITHLYASVRQQWHSCFQQWQNSHFVIFQGYLRICNFLENKMIMTYHYPLTVYDASKDV